jgi:hypothetical protein
MTSASVKDRAILSPNKMIFRTVILFFISNYLI